MPRGEALFDLPDVGADVMYEIEAHASSRAFTDCWRAAGAHLNRQVQGGLQSWLKAHLSAPSPEHFSFRLGNQLFFVRLEAGDWRWEAPGSLEGLLRIASRYNAHACVMPMARTASGWKPTDGGWGLREAQSLRPLNPVDLVTGEEIEMTDWELHDFAVQVVRGELEKQGRVVMSWQGSPEINPSIWIESEDSLEWVVVRAVRYPENAASIPANIDQISLSGRPHGKIGHFASVSVASADQSKCQTGEDSTKSLLRGHGLHVRFCGLTPLTERH
jgi:hypothetical protein